MVPKSHTRLGLRMAGRQTVRITPRKDEVAAIVAVLEQPHKNAEEAAKAVLKEAAELLGLRETLYALALGGGRKTVNFGPYFSPAEVESVAKQLAGATPEFKIARMGGSGLLAARMEGLPKGKKVKDFCANCQHAKDLHLVDSGRKARCALDCECTLYKEGG